MKRIAILDHSTHELMVEDINEEILEGQYGGEEQMYIEENYNLEQYSWDWITGTQYFPVFDKTPIDINFEEMVEP